MSKRNGGANTKKRTNVEENHIYFTPGKARYILEYLKPHISSSGKTLRILDACANDGVLGKTLNSVLGDDHNLYNQDKMMKNKDKFSIGGSIINYKPDHKYDVIICNPPWVPVNFALQVYKHLINLLKDRGVLLFVICNTFCYQGKDRVSEVGFQKFYFLSRDLFKGQRRSDGSEIGLLDCGVGVLHKDAVVPVEASKKPCTIAVPAEGFLQTLEMF